ncbi:unnamed protein product [Plutella xylostella]|uniref:(diamondback moth) hypothetical protein n=1 Tax=Plutella xylostella TaxID=51655 RepID=A0A8S4FNQ0_PLUXY|nr:unnamed protein product [Plutella xylostella]
MAQHIVWLSIFSLLFFIDLCPTEKLDAISKRIKRWNIENWNGYPNTPNNFGYRSAPNPPTRPDYNVHVHIHHAPEQTLYQPPSQQYNNDDYERGFHHGFYHGLTYQRLVVHHPSSQDHHNVPETTERDHANRPSRNMNPIPLISTKDGRPVEDEIKGFLSNVKLDVRNVTEKPLKFNNKPETSTQIEKELNIKDKNNTKANKDANDDIVNYWLNYPLTPITGIENSEKVVVKESEMKKKRILVDLKDVYLNTDPPAENPSRPPPYTIKYRYVEGSKINAIQCREFVWEARRNELRQPRGAACQKKKDWEAGVFGISVVGGEEAEIADYPHMGAIGWKAIDDTNGLWVFKCGCTLISHNFVLTAAHCTHVPVDSTIAESDPKIVRLGDNNIYEKTSDDEETAIDVKIIRIIVHPNYAAPKKYYDIALMELEKEVAFSTVIRPACLWNDEDTNKLPHQPTVTGWGVVDSATKTVSPTLQVAKLSVIDRETCDKLLKKTCNRNFCGTEEHQLCGGNLTGGVDTCQGDSGGPFQVQLDLPEDMSGSMHYVFGITSFGIGCGRANTPAVYTRVSYFTDWIDENVWPKEVPILEEYLPDSRRI